MKYQSLALAVLSTFNIAIVFVIQLVTFNIVGPGDSTDALFLGLAVPTLILSVTVTALNNVLVPLFSGKKNDDLYLLFSHLLVMMVSVGLCLSLLLELTINLWLPLIANGFSHQKYEFTKLLSQIQILVIPFSMIYSVLWSVLNSQKKHIQSELPPAIVNLIQLPILIYLIPKYGVIVLAIAFPLRMFLQCIALTFFFDLSKFKYKKLSITEFYPIWDKLKPIMLGSLYYKSEPIIDRSLLSNTSSGVLSLFFLSQQIYSAITQVIVKSIVTPTITKISTYNKDKLYELSLDVFKSTMLKLSLVISLVLVIGVLFGKEILIFILSFKSKTDDGAYLYFIMLLLSGSLIGNVFGSLISGTFYAFGNTKVPSYVSMITYTIYTPIKIISFIIFGIKGLSIAISCYAIINLLTLTLLLKRFFYEKEKCAIRRVCK